MPKLGQTAYSIAVYCRPAGSLAARRARALAQRPAAARASRRCSASAPSGMRSGRRRRPRSPRGCRARPRGVPGPLAVDVDAQLLAGALAVAADTARAETHAPFVEELAEREGAGAVALDVHDPARRVRAAASSRPGRRRRGGSCSRRRVSARAGRARGRAAAPADPGRDRHRAAVDDQVEMHVVVAHEVPDHRRQAGVGDLAQREAQSPRGRRSGRRRPGRRSAHGSRRGPGAACQGVEGGTNRPGPSVARNGTWFPVVQNQTWWPEKATVPVFVSTV